MELYEEWFSRIESYTGKVPRFCCDARCHDGDGCPEDEIIKEPGTIRVNMVKIKKPKVKRPKY